MRVNLPAHPGDWKAQSRGASLFELVMVIVLLSLLMTAVLPRLSGSGGVDLQVQAEQFRRDASRVQFLASAKGLRLLVSMEPGGYVVLCTAPASCAGELMTDPETGSVIRVALTQGALFSTSDVLEFDGLGRPVNGAGLLASSTTITLTRGSDVARVEVLPLTGLARMVSQ